MHYSLILIHVYIWKMLEMSFVVKNMKSFVRYIKHVINTLLSTFNYFLFCLINNCHDCIWLFLARIYYQLIRCVYCHIHATSILLNWYVYCWNVSLLVGTGLWLDCMCHQFFLHTNFVSLTQRLWSQLEVKGQLWEWFTCQTFNSSVHLEELHLLANECSTWETSINVVLIGHFWRMDTKGRQTAL